MEHQSSDHDELTHADCPPYKAGWSATWELVLFGLRPQTFRSTSAQKHTLGLSMARRVVPYQWPAHSGLIPIGHECVAG
jgi:hypothetical protein